MTTQSTGFNVYNDERKPRVAIAGGGLAGLACAWRLAEAGVEVELVEAATHLGGDCAGRVDPDSGEIIEHGLQTLWGSNSHLAGLLKAAGCEVERVITWHDNIGIVQPGARINRLALNPLRDLPQLISSLNANTKLVKPLDQLTLGLTLLNGLFKRADFESKTVSRMAQEARLSGDFIDKILRPITRSLTFAEPEELSAYVLLTQLYHVLAKPLNLRIGTLKNGLNASMIDPLAGWLRQHNAVLRTETALKTINFDRESGAIHGYELENGENLFADLYVAALPLAEIKKLLPVTISKRPFFQRLLQLASVPALTVQLWFDRSFVRRDQLLIASGSPLVIFQATADLTIAPQGSSISGQLISRKADGFNDAELVGLARHELGKYFPASRNALLQRTMVTRRQAVLLDPGSLAGRPTQATPVPNFFLAGNYTRQDWFGSLEGAVLSGEMAATAILRQLGWSVDDYDPRDIAHNVGLGGLRSNTRNALISALARRQRK